MQGLSLDRFLSLRMSVFPQKKIKPVDIVSKIKANNQMEWVRCMNSIRNRAEEIVSEYNEHQKQQNIWFFYLL